MPRTRAAFDAGHLTEWKVTILARETACLTLEHRRTVDRELAAAHADHPDGIGGLGERTLGAAAQRVAYRLDPHAAARRAAKAAADRHVSLRPAPDTMVRLSALLPVRDGVACQVVLDRHADQARARGDARSRGQVMADALVAGLTGRSPAVPAAVPLGAITWAQADSEGRPEADDDSPEPGPGPVIELTLLMSDESLLAGGDQPAHVLARGPVPAPLARAWLRDPGATVFLRRLYARPRDGALVALDSHRRRFPDGLRRLIVFRDDVCRTPWCEAPIRHVDHVVDAADGGPTSAGNGEGYCERCNYAKQAQGWRAALGEGGEVVTTTPTGWTCTSRIPAPVVVTGPGLLPELPPPRPEPDDWIHRAATEPSEPPDPPPDPWLELGLTA